MLKNLYCVCPDLCIDNILSELMIMLSYSDTTVGKKTHDKLFLNLFLFFWSFVLFVHFMQYLYIKSYTTTYGSYITMNYRILNCDITVNNFTVRHINSACKISNTHIHIMYWITTSRISIKHLYEISMINIYTERKLLVNIILILVLVDVYMEDEKLCHILGPNKCIIYGYWTV